MIYKRKIKRVGAQKKQKKCSSDTKEIIGQSPILPQINKKKGPKAINN